MRLPVFAALLAVATLAFAFSATAANPPRVRCGMVIEERAVLDRDLRCPGPALVLRNPRTVLQLNGHTVESSDPCSEAPTAIGISVEPSAEGAQILGPGSIRGFGTGIVIDRAPRAQVRDLRVSDTCSRALAVRSASDVQARNLILDRNGGGAGADGGAVRVENAERFVLESTSAFLNDSGGASGGVVDLRDCTACRVAGNRIVANQGVGLRLDVESRAGTIERNVILDQRPHDVVDQGADNTLALNVFERGDGVSPSPLVPLIGEPGANAPGVAGCGLLTTSVKPRASVTVTCPQDPGLRALRNSVVAYRFLNPFNTLQPLGTTCDPAEVQPASSSGGGSLSCTNADSVWTAVLEVTCCLN